MLKRVEDKWIIDVQPGGRKGKRVRQYLSGNIPEEIARQHHDNLARAETQEQAGAFTPIKYLVPKWLRHLEARASAQTIRVCKSSAGAHLVPFLGDYPIGSLNPMLSGRYQSYLLGKGLGKGTVNTHMVKFYMLCKWAKAQGWLNQEYHVENLRHTPRSRHPIGSQDVETFVHAVPTHYRGPTALMAYMGLRFNEAVSLKASDIDVNNNTLYVFGKGAKERILPITNEALPYLSEALKSHPTGLLWPSEGKPLTKLVGTFKAASKVIGKYVTPHILRHSFARRLLDRGISLPVIQKWLGHSNIQTTMTYLHVDIEDMRAAILSTDTPENTLKNQSLSIGTVNGAKNYPLNIKGL